MKTIKNKSFLWTLLLSLMAGVSCSDKINKENKDEDKLSDEITAVYAGVLLGSSGQIIVKEMKNGHHEMKLLFDKDQDGEDDVVIEVTKNKNVDLTKGHKDIKTGVTVKLIKESDGSQKFDVTIPNHGPVKSVAKKFDGPDANMFEVFQIEEGHRQVFFKMKADGSLELDKVKTSAEKKALKYLSRFTFNLILDKKLKTFTAIARDLELPNDFSMQGVTPEEVASLKEYSKALNSHRKEKITGTYTEDQGVYKLTVLPESVNMPSHPFVIDFSGNKKVFHKTLFALVRRFGENPIPTRLFRKKVGKTSPPENKKFIRLEHPALENKKDIEVSNDLNLVGKDKFNYFLITAATNEPDEFVAVSVIGESIYINGKKLAKTDYDNYRLRIRQRRKAEGTITVVNGKRKDSRGNTVDENNLITKTIDGSPLFEYPAISIDKVMFSHKLPAPTSVTGSFKGSESYIRAYRK